MWGCYPFMTGGFIPVGQILFGGKSAKKKTKTEP